MAIPFRYDFKLVAGSTAGFQNVDTQEVGRRTDSATATESFRASILLGSSASATINFGGVTQTRLVMIRSPAKFGVVYNAGAQTIYYHPGDNSDAFVFAKMSATAIKVINAVTNSALVRVIGLGT